MKCSRCGKELGKPVHGCGGQVRWCDECWWEYWERQHSVVAQVPVNLDEAKRSREHAGLNNYNTNSFYNEQVRVLAQWEWGKPPPEGLILGELPYVNPKQIRLDSD